MSHTRFLPTPGKAGPSVLQEPTFLQGDGVRAFGWKPLHASDMTSSGRSSTMRGASYELFDAPIVDPFDGVLLRSSFVPNLVRPPLSRERESPNFNLGQRSPASIRARRKAHPERYHYTSRQRPKGHTRATCSTRPRTRSRRTPESALLSRGRASATLAPSIAARVARSGRLGHGVRASAPASLCVPGCAASSAFPERGRAATRTRESAHQTSAAFAPKLRFRWRAANVDLPHPEGPNAITAPRRVRTVAACTSKMGRVR